MRPCTRWLACPCLPEAGPRQGVIRTVRPDERGCRPTCTAVGCKGSCSRICRALCWAEQQGREERICAIAAMLLTACRYGHLLGAGWDRGCADLLHQPWQQLLRSRYLFVGECFGRGGWGVREARHSQHWDHCIIKASSRCAVVGLRVYMQSVAMILPHCERELRVACVIVRVLLFITIRWQASSHGEDDFIKCSTSSCSNTAHTAHKASVIIHFPTCKSDAHMQSLAM